jgi:hypothetical protein
MSRNIVAFSRLSMSTHEQCEVVHHASPAVLRSMHGGTGVSRWGARAAAREGCVITDGLQRPYALFRKSST